MEQIGRFAACLLIGAGAAYALYRFARVAYRPWQVTRRLAVALAMGPVLYFVFAPQIIPSRYLISILGHLLPALLQLEALAIGTLSLRRTSTAERIVNAGLMYLSIVLASAIISDALLSLLRVFPRRAPYTIGP